MNWIRHKFVQSSWWWLFLILFVGRLVGWLVGFFLSVGWFFLGLLIVGFHGKFNDWKTHTYTTRHTNVLVEGYHLGTECSKDDDVWSSRGWSLETGDWRLEFGDWRLDTGLSGREREKRDREKERDRLTKRWLSVWKLWDGLSLDSCDWVTGGWSNDHESLIHLPRNVLGYWRAHCLIRGNNDNNIEL